jgi:hypothetical protein
LDPPVAKLAYKIKHHPPGFEVGFEPSYEWRNHLRHPIFLVQKVNPIEILGNAGNAYFNLMQNQAIY